MKDPNEEPEQPIDFVAPFREAVKKVSPEDFKQIQQETLNEMGAEARRGAERRRIFR